MTAGLLDTSVFIAREAKRQLNASNVPDESFVSVVTIAELHAGVLAATDTTVRAGRLRTLEAVAVLEPIPIDADVAAEWARLRVWLAEDGLRMNVNDLWIAATAASRRLPIVTQDADFDVLQAVDGPDVIHV